jgi:four helix bundle protein
MKPKGTVYEYPGLNTGTFAVLPGYRNLIVWQKACELAKLVHEATQGFGPAYYRLRGQTLDAAESVSANILEGYCSGSINNYVRYCEISRGSLGELGTHLHTCELWNLVSANILQPIIELYSDVRFLLDRLLNSLREKQAEKTWDSSYSIREPKPTYDISDEVEAFHQSHPEFITP